MTWIKTKPPTDPETARAMREGMSKYPSEYHPARRGERRLPPEVAHDSIVTSHSLIPEALEHAFGAYGALLGSELELSRREHELIATVVSVANQCHY